LEQALTGHLAIELQPFIYAQCRKVDLGGLVGARGAAWVIYPTVAATWLYLTLLALTRIWLGVVRPELALLGAVVLIGLGCACLVWKLDNKDVVPFFGRKA
jgi:hypothetical protein